MMNELHWSVTRFSETRIHGKGAYINIPPTRNFNQKLGSSTAYFFLFMGIFSLVRLGFYYLLYFGLFSLYTSHTINRFGHLGHRNRVIRSLGMVETIGR